MATNEQIKAYIQKLVKEEVERIAPKLIRETMARSLGQMMLEAADLHEIEHPAPARGNSDKRKALSEAVGTEEYPTMTGRTFTSDRVSEVGNRKAIKGLGITPPGGSSELITVDKAITENGTPVPINPNDLPEHLLKAFNHDYRNLMKTYLKDGGKA